MRGAFLFFVFLGISHTRWYDLGSRRVEILADDIIRVFHPSNEHVEPDINLMQDPRAQFPATNVVGPSNTSNGQTLATDRIKITWLRKDDRIIFSDNAGNKILEEGTYEFTPKIDMNESTHSYLQNFLVDPKSAVYGGGLHQNNILNYRNTPMNLIQYISEAVVPFFTSTDGWGLLVHNYGALSLNPCNQEIDLKLTNRKIKFDEAFGNFRHPYWKNAEYAYVLTSNFTSGKEGFYYFSVTEHPGEPHWARTQLFTINLNNETVAKYHDDNGASVIANRVFLQANTHYQIELIHSATNPLLCVRYPNQPDFTIGASIGDAVDYYFVHGPEMDRQVVNYQRITGAAPLYAKWAYGFWQCKEHYASQKELLDAASNFRKIKFPIDNIVQDWRYWGDLQWGPHWDFTNYSDPAQMVRTLHEENIHFMVSVWPKFDPSTEFYNEFKLHKWLIGKSNQYDATNADARHLYYTYSNISMFSIGVDGLWMDASEASSLPNVNNTLSIGSGNRFMNPYSLLTTQSIFDGFSKDYPDKRLFILTRSSFAGQQRNMATVWTGDISANWPTFSRQVANSINYAASGIPYWSEDIGGFVREPDTWTNPEYRELLTRWFQFGAFTPIFRIHGTGPSTEVWHFGETTMKNMNITNNLRYRFLPYIYSLAAKIFFEGGLMQRHLSFDYPADEKVYKINDQFMFGSDLLVAPITSPGGKREIYLPHDIWFDFWTGKVGKGGQVISVTHDCTTMPLFVREGSILYLGPFQQWSTQIPITELEVRVYSDPQSGSNAESSFYDDDGETNKYKNGDYKQIGMKWENGCFRALPTGKLEFKLTLNVIFVAPGKGIGLKVAQKYDIVLEYTGKPVGRDLNGKAC